MPPKRKNYEIGGKRYKQIILTLTDNTCTTNRARINSWEGETTVFKRWVVACLCPVIKAATFKLMVGGSEASSAVMAVDTQRIATTVNIAIANGQSIQIDKSETATGVDGTSGNITQVYLLEV